MQPTVETLSGLERKIDLRIALDEIEQEVGKRLQQLARTLKMPGFRPGKVPMKMVAGAHGGNLRIEVLNEKISRAFADAISAHQLRVAGSPRFEPNTDLAGTDAIAFSATFEVFPELSIPDFSTVELKRSVTEVNDAEIDRTIEILRKQRSTFTAVDDRPAENDDQLVIDFKGTQEGVAFEGGTAEGFSLVLGHKTLLPEFEAALLGMKAGERKTFDLTFPENYGAANLAGKTVQFEVAVQRVEKPELPALDEAFIMGLGISDGTVETLRSEVKANLEREVANRLNARNKNQAMQALLDHCSFEIPAALLENELQQVMEEARETLKAKGVPNAQSAQLPADVFKPQAERRLRLGLIIAELSRLGRVNAQASQIRHKLDELASSYQQPEQLIQWYMSDKARLSKIEMIVLEDNVVQWVYEQAKVNDEPVAFDELMGID